MNNDSLNRLLDEFPTHASCWLHDNEHECHDLNVMNALVKVARAADGLSSRYLNSDAISNFEVALTDLRAIAERET